MGTAAAILLWLVASPGPSDAYTISSVLTPGCHEDMTSEVLRAVRLDVPGAAPIPTTRDEQALVDDIQFTAAPDMKDLGAVSLLVSVRDNDLKGRSSDDLTELAEVHGNPDNQDEHCLRNRSNDEPGGSEAAVADCRKFIRGRVAEALEGLGANGVPDPAVRTALPLHLSLRGDIDALLPTFYVRMGQAIHGVEDSFTHAYRTADGMKITVVMNWVDKAERKFDEARDGPAHATQMDVCDDSDALRTTRRRLATEASAALLRAALDPLKTKAEKMATIDGVLDTYVSYAPGCTFANGWCDAPERQYQDTGSTFLGCSSGGGGLLGVAGGLLGIGLLLRRRRTTPSVMALLLVGGSLLLLRGQRPGRGPVPVPRRRRRFPCRSQVRPIRPNRPGAATWASPGPWTSRPPRSSWACASA